MPNAPNLNWERSLPGTWWRLNQSVCLDVYNRAAPASVFGAYSTTVLHYGETILVVAKPYRVIHPSAPSLLLTSQGRLIELMEWEKYCELVEAE